MKTRFRLTLLAGAALGLSIAAVASAGHAKQALTVTHVRAGAPTAMAGYGSAPELAVQQASYKLGAATNPGFVLFSDPTNDATAKITIYSPPGHTTTLTHTPAGLHPEPHPDARGGGRQGVRDRQCRHRRCSAAAAALRTGRRRQPGRPVAGRALCTVQ